MNTTERDTIATKADMIVCGYAFLRTEDTFIHVVNLNTPFHALVMTQDGEIMETNMDDIEISIVVKLWIRNKKLLEEAYA